MSEDTTADNSAAEPPRRTLDLVRRLVHDERIRFLFVGGFNTVVGYAIFVLVQLTIGKHTSYLLSLYVATFLGTVVAFVTHRRFTFRISGRSNILVDFFRFASVNVVSLVINTIALPLLVELAHFNPIAAQALIVVVTTTVSYVGHKFFSFRRGKRATDRPEEPR